MVIRYVFLCVTVSIVQALETDIDCADQFATKSSVILQGKTRDFDNYPPPYRFSFTDSNGRATGEYADDVYTVRVSGETPFRGFIIQARLATQQGFIIGHLTAGQFVEEPRWEYQGIKFMECSNSGNSSITSANDVEKYSIEAKWQPLKKEGPVQFVITVIQSEDTYWSLWQPQSGFIVPSKIANFSNHRSKLQQGQSFSIEATQKPLLVSTDPDSMEESAEEKRFSTPPENTQIAENTGETTSVPIKRFNISLGTSGRLSIKAIHFEETESGTTPRPSAAKRKLPEPPPFNMTNSGEERDENALTETEDSSGQVEATPGAPTVPVVFTTRSLPSTPAVIHPTTETEETTTLASLPPCDINVCEHNGTCKGYPRLNRYFCLCKDRWTGRHCDELNYCYKNKCENGVCVSDDTSGTYTCECNDEWAGQYCERPCPSYLCFNGGNCTISNNGEYGCICPTGYTGTHCETDIDDCVNAGCLHGTCIDKLNGFECLCSPGYMGDRCHRPCQDIYKSCDFWGEQDRCETMRPSTRFFDINCAVTCGQCEFDNSTVSPRIPLPPVLEPFQFLLGKWTLNSTTSRRFPLDFKTATNGYYEVLEIMPAEAIQFGTPSLSFKARAFNRNDSKDQQITVGFLTLGPGTKPLKVSLMHTGNDGMTIMEEGLMEETKMELEMVYLTHAPGMQDIAPARAKRHFAIKGPYLQEAVERHGSKGQSEYFAKYFIRESRYTY